jgi:hypothetical protein
MQMQRATVFAAMAAALVILELPTAWGAGMASKAETSSKTSHGWEARQSRENRLSHRHSASVSEEQNASAVLIPILRQAETGGLRLKSRAISQLVEACQVFTGAPLVGSIWAYCQGTGAHVMPYLQGAGMAEQVLFGALQQTGDTGLCSGQRWAFGQINTAKGAANAATVPDSILVPQWRGELKTHWFQHVFTRYGARLTDPLFATVCYAAEARILANAERLLASEGQRQGGGYRITMGQATQAVVDGGGRSVITTAMRLVAPAFQQGSGCVVPAKPDVVYNPAENSWTCAGVQVNAGQRTASAGGLTILGDGTFWGRSLRVSLSSEGSRENAQTTSHSSYSSGESSSSSSSSVNITQ